MTAKLYVNTDIDIKINIGAGLEIGDIEGMEVTLTLAGAEGKTFSGNAIGIGETDITLSIPRENGISVPGSYIIKILFTDGEGNIRGLTPTPGFLKFDA